MTHCRWTIISACISIKIWNNIQDSIFYSDAAIGPPLIISLFQLQKTGLPGQLEFNFQLTEIYISIYIDAIAAKRFQLNKAEVFLYTSVFLLIPAEIGGGYGSSKDDLQFIA